MAEKRLKEEDPHHESGEKAVGKGKDKDNQEGHRATVGGDESENIWKQAKEVLDILNHRGDTGGRPLIYRKDKSKKRKVRFDDEDSDRSTRGSVQKMRAKYKLSGAIDMSRVHFASASAFQGSEDLNDSILFGETSVSLSAAPSDRQDASITQQAIQLTANNQQGNIHSGSSSLEAILAKHTSARNNEGMWMAKALKQHLLPNAGTSWGVFSDPITMGRCFIQPFSQKPVGISLMEAVAITSTPQ
jgi:hypothetical protein